MLETVPVPSLERSGVLPEVTARRSIILRDRDPGEPEQALGGFGDPCSRHAVEIEVYVEQDEAAARDAEFDALLPRWGRRSKPTRRSAASPSA